MINAPDNIPTKMPLGIDRNLADSLFAGNQFPYWSCEQQGFFFLFRCFDKDFVSRCNVLEALKRATDKNCSLLGRVKISRASYIADEFARTVFCDECGSVMVLTSDGEYSCRHDNCVNNLKAIVHQLTFDEI